MRTQPSSEKMTTERRAAPRRKKLSRRRPPRRILSLWARLGVLVLTIAVIMLAAVCLLAKAVKPYREAGVQARQLAATNRQIAALDRANALMRRRITYLNTNDGIASQARRSGYLRPGERPIVVEGTEPAVASALNIDSSPVAQVPESAPSAQTSLNAKLRGFWQTLTGDGR